MAQVPAQGFRLGQRVWFADGRSALIEQAVFNPNAAQWQYDLGPLGRFFLESDLLGSDPLPDIPPFIPRPIDIPTPTLSVEAVAELIEQALAIFREERNAALTALELRRIEVTQAQVNLLADLIDNLESQIVTQQSEITNRLESQDLAADETGDGGIAGFLRRVGGFALNPFNTILTALEEYILAGVLEGLRRR